MTSRKGHCACANARIFIPSGNWMGMQRRCIRACAKARRRGRLASWVLQHLPCYDEDRFRGVTPLKAGTSAQDYRVHIKHTDGSFEYIPYFCLPANELNDVIAPSCYSCFDYPNALADLVSNVAVPYSFDWYCACATALCVLKAALP